MPKMNVFKEDRSESEIQKADLEEFKGPATELDSFGRANSNRKPF